MCQFWKTFSHSFCHEIIPHSTHMITPGEKALKRAKNAILDRHERKLEHGAAILRAWNHNYFATTTTTAGAPKALFCPNHNHNWCTKSTCYRSNRWRRTAHNWATGPWGESPFSCFVRNILFRLVSYKRLALLHKLDTWQLFALSKQWCNCANHEHAKSDVSNFVWNILPWFFLALPTWIIRS